MGHHTSQLALSMDKDDLPSSSSVAMSSIAGSNGSAQAGDEEKRRSKKKKKKTHSNSPTAKSRGPLLSERAQGSFLRARSILGDALARLDPRGAILEARLNARGVLRRVGFLLWIIIIVFSLLNLLGLAPALPSMQSEPAEPVDTLGVSEEPVVEEIIVQKLPAAKSQIVNLALERDFGCRELECIAQCNGKAKPKCLKSRSCVIERDKICQKRCRKARCEDRCKDEPHLGYVEREQG